MLTGKGYGSTNFIAMDRSGEILVDRVIQVEGPTDQLATVYRGVERELLGQLPAELPAADYPRRRRALLQIDDGSGRLSRRQAAAPQLERTSSAAGGLLGAVEPAPGFLSAPARIDPSGLTDKRDTPETPKLRSFSSLIMRRYSSDRKDDDDQHGRRRNDLKHDADGCNSFADVKRMPHHPIRSFRHQPPRLRQDTEGLAQPAKHRERQRCADQNERCGRG